MCLSVMRYRGLRAFEGTLAVFTLALGLGACGSDEKQSAELECGPGDFAEADSELLFSEPEVPRFDIKLHGTTWPALMAKARDEEYTAVDACYGGKSIGRIGLRFKGQVGSLSRCFDGDELICNKLSMRLKFDFEDEKLRFFGLKHLNLHSLTGDASHLHERLAYDLYRDMQVDAPRSDWAELVVDGKAQGLYSMVEQIDGRFVSARWPDAGDGNLYKEAWPTRTDSQYFRDRLDTHEETGTPTSILSFAEGIAGADSTSGLSVVSEYMDTSQLYRYLAVDDATLNWDGITAFYANEDGTFRNHNFFIFEKPTGAAGAPLQLIPWDMDHTFELPNWRLGAPYWGDAASACPQVVLGCATAGCDPILHALASDREAYRDAVHALLQGPLADGLVEARVSEQAARIEAAVRRDSFGPTPSAWRDEVEHLRASFPILREYVRRRADGPAIERLAVPAQGVTDFSHFDDTELLFGASALVAPGGSAAVAKAPSDAPFPGLRLKFGLPRESQGWAVYFLPLEAPNLDVRNKVGVRFRARGVGTKYVGLNIDSAEGDVGTTRWTWPLALDEQTKTYELRFADLIWPEPSLAGPSQELVLTHVQEFVFVAANQGQDAQGYVDIADFELF